MPIYHKTYHSTGDDEALDVVMTTDGGSIVVGHTTSNTSEWDGFLLRLNAEGDVLWSQSYGGDKYDELTKVRQTSDGGFIMLGKTKSYGQETGAAWLMKTDGSGNLLWSRQFKHGNEPLRPKCLLELNDGSFAIALNVNDSTSQGNGIIVHTDGSGFPVWSKVFDHRGDDGINQLFQDGNTLLVGGYATVADREGVLMRLNVNDGAVLWAKRFARRDGWSDEIVNVESIAGGLAFGASSTWTKTAFDYNPYYLTLFKTTGDDSIYFQRRVEVTTPSGRVIESLALRNTPDGGFVYAANDTTPLGRPVYQKISPAGIQDWGRYPETYTDRRLYGLDLAGDMGYVMAGYVRSFYPENKSQIQVLKTDIGGRTGSCKYGEIGAFTDTTLYQISSFTWNSIAPDAITFENLIPVVRPLSLKTTALCSDTYCSIPDPVGNNVCLATVLAHLKGVYNFMPYDLVKVSDGYLLFGYYRMPGNEEPMIVKLQTNGQVSWSKTLNVYMHSQGFDQVVEAGDGNFLVTGRDFMTINHGSYNGDLVMKITPGGDVLWSKYVDGDICDIHPDKSSGFVGTITKDYGFPPIDITLFKMDVTGNFSWQKQLNSNYESSPIYRRIVYDGTYIYAAGEFYNQFPQNIAVEKLDTAGNHLWTKMFTVNGFATSVEALEMIGDSIYLMTNFYDNSQNQYMAKKKFAAIKIGKDGKGMNGFSLESIDMVDDGNVWYFLSPRLQRVTKTFDDQFVIAERATGVSDSSLVFTKFSSTGQVIWSLRYDGLNQHYVSRIKDDNGSLLLLGRKYNGINDNVLKYEPLFMRTDAAGKVTENGSGYCHTVPNVVQTKPVKFVDLVFRPFMALPGSRTTKSYQVNAPRAFVVNATISCGLDGNCSKVSIVGSSAVCNVTDTFTYSILRNQGCTVPPYWRYDTTSIRTVLQSDTSVAVLFRLPGQFKIAASLLSGCGIVSDTILVSVPKLTNSLTLGSDTTICAGTSFLINARKGYVSYLWQDGSTDSTFVVTKPGLYYVSVNDACNRTYTDTIRINPHPPILFDVGADRTKCDADTIWFTAPAGFLNYNWSPGYNISSQSGRSVVVNPSMDTTYFVRAEKTPGCFAYDTVLVKVYHALPIQLGSDLQFCKGDSALLDAGAGFSSYAWNTGERTQKITIKTKGNYSIVGTTANGCKSTDTLIVKDVWPLPSIHLDKNAGLCAGDTRLLNAGNFVSYYWQDGSTGATYIVKDTGTYVVRVTDSHGCISTDATVIKAIVPLPTRFLPPDTAICPYGTLTIQPINSFSSYLWSDGSRAPNITVEKPGFFWLQAENQDGCIGRDTILVNSKECMAGLYVPSAFTPNQDGKNDMFRAQVFGLARKFELTVYNRWGQVVFYAVDQARGWDGKVGGIKQETGVYVWTCRYQLEGLPERLEKGTVTVIR